MFMLQYVSTTLYADSSKKGGFVPRVTVHPSSSTWKIFGFEDCGSLANLADMLTQNLDQEFRNGLITELYISKPYIAIKFSKVLPTYWCLRVIDAAHNYVRTLHGESKEITLCFAK